MRVHLYFRIYLLILLRIHWRSALNHGSHKKGLRSVGKRPTETGEWGRKRTEKINLTSRDHQVNQYLSRRRSMFKSNQLSIREIQYCEYRAAAQQTENRVETEHEKKAATRRHREKKSCLLCADYKLFVKQKQKPQQLICPYFRSFRMKNRIRFEIFSLHKTKRRRGRDDGGKKSAIYVFIRANGEILSRSRAFDLFSFSPSPYSPRLLCLFALLYAIIVSSIVVIWI